MKKNLTPQEMKLLEPINDQIEIKDNGDMLEYIYRL